MIIIKFQLAEREGFEPPERRRSTVFKTAAFDHSAISPATKVEKSSFHTTPATKKISQFKVLIISILKTKVHL